MKLEEWYGKQTDDIWEHSFGVTIETLDNPGWSVVIDLVDTDMEGKKFTRVEVENSDEDWIHCWVKINKFEGRGGMHNLSTIIAVFRYWTENTEGRLFT